MRFEVLERRVDRAVPLEAEVAVSGSDRYPRDHRRPRSGSVNVQLLAADPIGHAPVDLDDLGTENISVERVRSLEIADRNDDVVEAHVRTIEASR